MSGVAAAIAAPQKPAPCLKRAGLHYMRNFRASSLICEEIFVESPPKLPCAGILSAKSSRHYRVARISCGDIYMKMIEMMRGPFCSGNEIISAEHHRNNLRKYGNARRPNSAASGRTIFLQA